MTLGALGAEGFGSVLDRVGSVIMTGLYSLFLRPLIGRRKIVGRDRPQKLSVERSNLLRN